MRVTAEVQDIRTALDAVKRSLAKGGTRPVLEHVRVELSGEWLTFTTTDGYRACSRSIRVQSIEDPEPAVAYFSRSTLIGYMDRIGKHGPEDISLSYTEVTWPNLATVIPEPNRSVAFNVKYLKDAVAAFQDEEYVYLDMTERKPLLMRPGRCTEEGEPKQWHVVMPAHLPS